MDDVFAIAQVGLQAGQERLHTISGNAAHATLPGYRRQVSGAAAFSTHFESGSAADSARVERGIDLRPGQAIATGKALDLAIEGDRGFFALSDGSRLYLTRAGSFQVDADGFLVGTNGWRVQGAQGDIRLNGSNVTVTGAGQIVHDGQVQATLQLVVPADGSRLKPHHGALMVVEGPVEPVSNGSTEMRSGFLEASNSGGPQDMLSLMALTRQFESLVRISQGYDEALGRTIQKLGEV